ncbi:MAG: histidinol phosphate phosphatase, partial [Lachnospiraceae bacterium]|nr:histidinol phosphate phosphatase [Lachnospiraceae bacterium]
KNHTYSYRQYADVIDEILKILVRDNHAIEINTAGIRKQLGFPNPHPDILRRYRELGGTLVTVGSDAHRAYAVGFAVNTAVDILRSCGFTHMVYYEKRKPQFVPLRWP